MDERVTILFLGDSTMAPRPARPWPGKVVRGLVGACYPVRGVNLAAGGFTTAHALTQLRSEAAAVKPDIVVMSFGINDAWVDIPGEFAPRVLAQTYLANLAALVAGVKRLGAIPVLLSPLPVYQRNAPDTDPEQAARIAGNVILYARLVKEAAARWQVPFVNLHAQFGETLKRWPGPPTELTGDGVHPTVIAHRQIALLMAKPLAELVRARIEGRPLPLVPPPAKEPLDPVALDVSFLAAQENAPFTANLAYRLGLAYAAGAGALNDPMRSIDWYRKAAEEGHQDAQYRVGLMLFAQANETHKREGIDWLRKAGEGGHPHAKVAHIQALETMGDKEAAMTALRELAATGHTDSMYRLAGSLVVSNDATERQEGMAWMERAAREGHFHSRVRMAELHNEAGRKEEALPYLMALAAEGHIVSQYRLGKWYLAGEGVSPDRGEAERWLRVAAAAGYAAAITELKKSFPDE
ncbi:MAG: SEL1-like repeat protein [Nitrospinae bacterium]|nr:SEL1-like repeat protein [Nitrospinota bacterium]